jgi:hypothetical protein
MLDTWRCFPDFDVVLTGSVGAMLASCTLKTSQSDVSFMKGSRINDGKIQNPYAKMKDLALVR